MDAFVRALAIGLVDARYLMIGHGDTCSGSLEDSATSERSGSGWTHTLNLRIVLTRPTGIQAAGWIECVVRPSEKAG
jgi:hypothetical protein